MAPVLPVGIIGISARPVSGAASGKIHYLRAMEEGQKADDQRDSRVGNCEIHGGRFKEVGHAHKMTDADWISC